MNEALLLLSLFSLLSARPLFGTKDPILQGLNPTTKHELLKGQYPEAVAELSAAIHTDSLNPKLYYLRGACHRRMQEYPAAVADHSRAIRLDAEKSWGYAGRGDAHFAMRHLRQARNDYQQAIKRTPSYVGDSQVGACLGVCHLYLNEVPQAITWLSGANQLDLRNDFALYYLTVAQTIARQPQPAAASCKEYIRWHVKRPEGYVNRALLNCSIGDYQQATADVKLALELAPTDTASALANVIILESSGKMAEAHTQLAGLLAKTTSPSALHLDLGDLYLQAGKTGAANEQWALAQQLGNAEAAERLAAKFRPTP